MRGGPVHGSYFCRFNTELQNSTFQQNTPPIRRMFYPAAKRILITIKGSSCSSRTEGHIGSSEKTSQYINENHLQRYSWVCRSTKEKVHKMHIRSFTKVLSTAIRNSRTSTTREEEIDPILGSWINITTAGGTLQRSKQGP